MQRIFETARKMGLPLIVTDVAGREPFVLLPLDQFEAMVGGEGPSGVLSQPAGVAGPASDRAESVVGTGSVPAQTEEMRFPVQEKELTIAEKSVEMPVKVPEAPVRPQVEVLPLEERFYFDSQEQDGRV